ncbi:hypothetical protein VB776_24250 [Arcicella sp. DC2W]|uniref:Uncharacterized protein n=1 Tax=Arcicella gelida TaxID=2984195 RepID=A0ABU5SC76_9BACT|nr:hypothetical protein [Arcicella sp. DC2W]MEA5406073.1 hypothetical protein [Arcicella sp. DC2W]
MKTKTKLFTSYDLIKAIERAANFIDAGNHQVVQDKSEVLPDKKGYRVTIKYHSFARN